jgi:phenylacetate-CoA ligase
MKKRNLLNALASFLREHPAEPDDLRQRVRQAALDVPAYQTFLSEHGLEPDSLLKIPWPDLPVMTKENYILAYPLTERCVFGSLHEADTFAVSSGTTGAPTIWPRSLVDELDASFPFEFVIRNFDADRIRTLMIVAFPLGIWIGGMHSTSTLRLLAAKGFPIAVISPGANPEEIARAVGGLAQYFDQVILVGYPPFIRDVLASELPNSSWATVAPRLIMAGESFTEEWRDRVHALAGRQDLLHSSASVYGTADAGVLAFETPASIQVRRLASNSPELCQQLFGQERIPALMQYNGTQVHFDDHQGELLFSKTGTMPLVRYNIGDNGGVYTPAELSARLQEALSAGLVSCPAELITSIQNSPYSFVYLFGRSDSTVSFFGANIYAEHISSAINKAPAAERLTGRFYMETFDSPGGEKQLRLVVETRGDTTFDEDETGALRRHVEETLRTVNSEYKNYVPREQQKLMLKVVPFGSDSLFSRKGKQKYSKKSLEPEEK